MAPATLFIGKTLEDAVKKGLDALGISRAEAMITVIEEGSGGFLGLGARPYRVRIMPRPGGPIREPEEREGRKRTERGERGGKRERGSRPERAERAERAERGAKPERGPRRERGGRTRDGERAPVAASGEREERRPAPRGEEPRGPERTNDRGGERRGEGPRPFERRAGERRRGEGAPRFDGAQGEARPVEGREPAELRERREDMARQGGFPRREDRPRPDNIQRGAPMGAAPMMGEAPEGPMGEGGEEPRRRRRRGRRGGRGRGGMGRPGVPLEAETPSDSIDDAPAFAPVHDRPMGRSMDAAFATPPVSAYQPLEPAAALPAPAPMEPFAESPRSDEPLDMEAPMPPRDFGGRPERRPFRDSRRRDEPRVRPASDTPGLSSDALAAEGLRCTQELLRAMGFESKVTATASEDRVDVVAEVGADDEMLNGAKGEVRQALQHLLNRMVNKGEGSRYHLQLEINDFWKRREEELQALARQLADRAFANQAEALTEYLNAQERRIIHVALREDSRVKTYALGDGMIKRLAVAPADFPESGRAE
jgi:predicted RNA-binding protein Jag